VSDDTTHAVLHERITARRDARSDATEATIVLSLRDSTRNRAAELEAAALTAQIAGVAREYENERRRLASVRQQIVSDDFEARYQRWLASAADVDGSPIARAISDTPSETTTRAMPSACLHAATAARRARQAEHVAEAWRLHLGGLTNADIARAMGRHPVLVSRWICIARREHPDADETTSLTAQRERQFAALAAGRAARLTNSTSPSEPALVQHEGGGVTFLSEIAA